MRRLAVVPLEYISLRVFFFGRSPEAGSLVASKDRGRSAVLIL